MPPTSSAVPSVADRLLEAQVAYLLDRLDDDQLADTLAQAVDDVLTVAATIRLADLDIAAVQAIARRVVRTIAASPEVEELVTRVADGVYETGGEALLGDALAREPVEALVAQLLAMQTMQDRLLDRATESPLAGAVAARFVTSIVSDVVAQNRQRAEKLPGMSSLLSFGQSAASRMPGMGLLTDAAGKGAQFAVRSTRGAMRELMRDAPMHGAAMEVWDLHADEPVGELRAYLSAQEWRDLVLIVHDLVVSARDSEVAGELIDVAVVAFVEQFGDRDLAALLAELGLDRDALVADATRLAPAFVAAVRTDGTLETILRDRLEPFFHSAAVDHILARPRPAKS